ncbi:MAG TPA: dienelactone hydrolase family protein [Ktedonobacterales bacterium]
MTGRMIEFDAGGSTTPGYLAEPAGAAGPGVIVLHAWWGLTEPFRQACDRLAEAGFVALAPDLYRGKTTASIEEAETLSSELFKESARAEKDVQAAARFLRERGASNAPDGHGKLALIGFSLGGAYALDASVTLPDEVAAVVIFYATYTGPDYSRARAAYLGHFAEHDPYEPAEGVAELEQALRDAGKSVTFYTYPGTTHWFFEANRPDAFNAEAAAQAWDRTIAFLDAQLRQS